MKKPVVFFCVWSIASIIAWSMASPVRAQSPGVTLAKYRGDWACTFQSPVSLSGPLMGIELIHLDRAGRVTAEETVASTDPFVPLKTTFSGRLSPQENGTLKGVLVLHIVDPPGIPDQNFDILCAGMDLQGDRYNEMRCLDFLPQLDGSKVVGITSCRHR